VVNDQRADCIAIDNVNMSYRNISYDTLRIPKDLQHRLSFRPMCPGTTRLQDTVSIFCERVDPFIS
jgi:hypothetical protein